MSFVIKNSYVYAAKMSIYLSLYKISIHAEHITVFTTFIKKWPEIGAFTLKVVSVYNL